MVIELAGFFRGWTDAMGLFKLPLKRHTKPEIGKKQQN